MPSRPIASANASGVGSGMAAAVGVGVGVVGEVVLEVDEDGAREVAGGERVRPDRPSRYQRTSASTTSSRWSLTQVGIDEWAPEPVHPARRYPGDGAAPAPGHTGLTVSVQSFQNLFAVLALAAMTGAVVLLIASLLRSRSALAASHRRRLRPARPAARVGRRRHVPRPAASTSPRSPATRRARCAGTSASACTRSC